MQLKRVDVNIRRAIRATYRYFGIITRTKKNCLSKLYQITWLFLVSRNWSKSVVKAKYKVAKLRT